jgi:hypothetical protein
MFEIAQLVFRLICKCKKVVAYTEDYKSLFYNRKNVVRLSTHFVVNVMLPKSV